MKKVNIANLNIEIDTVEEHFLSSECQKYEHKNFRQPDLILRTKYFEEITKPVGEIIEQIRDVTIVRMGENRSCRYLSINDTGQIAIAIYYNQTYSEVEIHLRKNLPQPSLSLAEYEYLYTGFAFGNRLAELGGTVLHGSGIAYNQQGIIFSANCGTGKSTHASLWKECFAGQVTVVNDDKPAIRFDEGIPYMFGTPWSGKSTLHTNIQVPLKAIIFIRRAETNSIERLNLKDGIFCLMSQISRPYYDEKLSLKTMAIIEKLVQTIPIYTLHCNISQKAVDTVYRQLTQDRVITP